MATYRDPHALAASQARRFARLERSIKAEHWELAKTMAYEAAKLSTGDTSSLELARLGHPFGRGKMRKTIKVGATPTVVDGKKGAKLVMRGGTRHRVSLKGSVAMSVPILPINRQTGKLLRGWRLMPRRSSAMQMFILQNVAPHSKFVLNPGGTKRMIDRGFWKEMHKIFKPHNKQTIQKFRYLTLLEMRKAG